MRYLYENFSKYYDLFFENNAFYHRCIQFIEATVQEYGHNPNLFLNSLAGRAMSLSILSISTRFLVLTYQLHYWNERKRNFLMCRFMK